MTREDIIAQVNSLLAEEFEVEGTSFEPEANVKDILNLDSLSLVDLVALVQQTYKVKIPITELRSIQTFSNLYDYIESHLPTE
ncbi:acyl carrier protein [Parabacteroides distasonis]|uniref:acyl carrier protein n=1 Tax=Parabacteroides distasonis TaxID=823 RepID=UPI00232E5DB2|nr:acyl carrier protein [Parabacteroides distasonis]MDB9029201.1 acyl carrier protein [Parabacteroides distasonis]MDB9075002.1 acyl carrier protein [Parabacteroides distasonis]